MPVKGLLVAQPLVSRDKDLELARCERQEGTILLTGPPHFGNRSNIVLGEELAQAPRNAFVK
jgi:hypothetical protein